MQIFRDRKLNISVDFCILAASFLLLLPLKWVLAWFVASAVHELSHVALLRLLGIRIFSVSLGASGVEIESEAMLPVQEIVCALAGPLGGLCLVFFGRIAPHLGICAFVQSVFNLIPVYPLDGGRALRLCMHRHFENHTAKKICCCVENVVLAILFFCAFAGTFLFKLGYMPIAIVLIVFIKCKKIKIPCKPGEQIVQ